jgi:hypothetical protein
MELWIEDNWVIYKLGNMQSGSTHPKGVKKQLPSTI